MSTDICEVIITGPPDGTLHRFVHHLVTERLAACGQIIDTIQSIYRWDGGIQNDPEARVALHTRLSLVDQIVALAAELHPYDVPCIIALPVMAANPAYVQWVLDETQSPQ